MVVLMEYNKIGDSQILIIDYLYKYTSFYLRFQLGVMKISKNCNIDTRSKCPS